MLRKKTFLTRIIIGALIIIAGIFQLNLAYESWRDYYTYDFDLGGIVTGLAGAILCFFIVALLLIKDRYYIVLSIRWTSFAFGLVVAIAGMISFSISVWSWVGYFSGGGYGLYAWNTIAPISLLLSLFLGLISLILFLRVRQSGGIRIKTYHSNR